MRTYKDLQEKQNQMLTVIAEKLSKQIPQSEIYEIMDDIADIHDIVENRLGWLDGEIDSAFILLDKIGK